MVDFAVEIYALLHPVTKEVRYIGKARDSLKRLKSHIRDSRRRKTPLYSWIVKLAGLGLTPEVSVLVSVPDSEWRDNEIRAIAFCRANGVRLLNIADGGDEPFCSTEQRAKNGISVALAIHSDPDRKRMWKLKKNLGIFKKLYGFDGQFA